LIEEEKKSGNFNLESLYKTKENHKRKVELLTEVMINGTQPLISIEEVGMLRDELLSLKHTGETFHSILSASKELEESLQKEMDTTVLYASENTDSVNLGLFQKLSRTI